MATLITGKDSPARTEVCPNCLDDVRLYARLTGLNQWMLVKECPCNYIAEDVRWPFSEKAALSAVKPTEFAQHGILLFKK